MDEDNSMSRPGDQARCLCLPDLELAAKGVIAQKQHTILQLVPTLWEGGA